MSEQFQKVYSTLRRVRSTLQSNDLAARVQESMPAAELHAFYNQVGLKKGWLQPEYATPLSKQNTINQTKHVDAALDVINYWILRFEQTEASLDSEGFQRKLHAESHKVIEEGARNFLINEMKSCVDYEINRGLRGLEDASASQHNQWRNFVNTYQKERITLGHAKFRQENYDQFKKNYTDLEEEVKDQDRLIVSVITDVVLGLSDIDYKRKIDTTNIFSK